MKLKTVISLVCRIFEKKTPPPAQEIQIPSLNIYRHCSEMPLDAFIDAVVNGNHARIVKFGKATPYQIMEGWKNLYSEYCDISDTKPYKHLFALNKDIGHLHGRLLQVRTCLKVLSIQYVKYCEVSLQNMGYSIHLDQSDRKKYIKALKDVEAKSKTIELSLMIKKDEHAKAMEEFGGKDITEADFVRNLVELSGYMKFHINAKEITVLEYVEIRKKYELEAEHLEKLQNKS